MIYHSLQQSTIFFTNSENLLRGLNFLTSLSLIFSTLIIFMLIAKNKEYKSNADLKYASDSFLFPLACSLVPTSIKRMLAASRCLLMHHSSPFGFVTIFAR